MIRARSLRCATGLGNGAAHTVDGLEGAPGMGDQLAVGRVIHRFDAGQPLQVVGKVCLQVPDERQLGLPGPDEKPARRTANGVDDAIQEIEFDRRMAGPDCAGLVMDLAEGIVRLEHLAFDIHRVEVEDVGFLAVHPDDCVIVRHWCSRSRGGLCGRNTRSTLMWVKASRGGF